MFLKYLFGLSMTHDMPCGLETILEQVNGHIQSRISCIFANVIIFSGMFITQLL